MTAPYFIPLTRTVQSTPLPPNLDRDREGAVRMALPRVSRLLGLLALALALFPATSRADLFELHIPNLTSLASGGADYSPDFTLIGSQGNQVTLSGATLGGGMFSGPASLMGGASG